MASTKKKTEDIPVAVVVRTEPKTSAKPTSIVTMVPKPIVAVRNDVVEALKYLSMFDSEYKYFVEYRCYVNSHFISVVDDSSMHKAIDAPFIVARCWENVLDSFMGLRTICLKTYLYWECHLSIIIDLVSRAKRIKQ